HDAGYSISRSLGFVGDYGQLFADKSIQQRGLACIRSANDRDETGAKRHTTSLPRFPVRLRFWWLVNFLAMQRRYAHTFHSTLGGLQNLKPQPFVLHDFPGRRDVSGELRNEAANGSRLPVSATNIEQIGEPIDIHSTWHNVVVIFFTHYVAVLVLVAQFSYNFFDQVFDRHHSGDATVLVDNDCHADVLTLHLA